MPLISIAKRIADTGDMNVVGSPSGNSYALLYPIEFHDVNAVVTSFPAQTLNMENYTKGEGTYLYGSAFDFAEKTLQGLSAIRMAQFSAKLYSAEDTGVEPLPWKCIVDNHVGIVFNGATVTFIDDPDTLIEGARFAATKYSPINGGAGTLEENFTVTIDGTEKISESTNGTSFVNTLSSLELTYDTNVLEYKPVFVFDLAAPFNASVNVPMGRWCSMFDGDTVDFPEYGGQKKCIVGFSYPFGGKALLLVAQELEIPDTQWTYEGNAIGFVPPNGNMLQFAPNWVMPPLRTRIPFQNYTYAFPNFIVNNNLKEE